MIWRNLVFLIERVRIDSAYYAKFDPDLGETAEPNLRIVAGRGAIHRESAYRLDAVGRTPTMVFYTKLSLARFLPGVPVSV